MTDHHDIDTQDFELRRRLRGLSADRDPSLDLWPGIAQRLERIAQPASPPSRRQRHSRWPGWMALAASVLGVAVLADFWPTAVQTPTAVVEAPVASDAAIASARSLRIQAQAMTVEYQAALAEVGGAPLPLPLQAAAAELDRSALQIRDAMNRDPQSSFLLERLRDVYAQRLRLSQRGLLA